MNILAHQHEVNIILLIDGERKKEMKKYKLIIFIMIIVSNSHIFAQQYTESELGWNLLKVTPFSVGVSDNVNPFYSFLGGQHAFSFGRSKPIERFGIGTTLLEYYTPYETTSVFPVHLYFIPYINIREIVIQPIDHAESIPGGIRYYYDPDAEKEQLVADLFVYTSIGGSLWAANRNGSSRRPLFSDRQYLKIELGVDKYIKLTEKVLYNFEVWTIGLNTGIVVMGNIGESGPKSFFYFGINIAVASRLTIE